MLWPSSPFSAGLTAAPAFAQRATVAIGGRSVAPGTRPDLIGTVTDDTGREIERIVSPVDGHVMYGLTGPPVKGR